MNVLTPLNFRLSSIWFVISLNLGLGLTFLVMVTARADTPPEHHPDPTANSNSGATTRVLSSQDTEPPAFPPDPLVSPANGATLLTSHPVLDWKDASDPSGVISYTVLITKPSGQVAITTTNSVYTSTQPLPNGTYSWTVRAHDTVGNASNYVDSYTFNIAIAWQAFLPIILNPESAQTCPATSSASYNLIPIDGPPADHPDYLHGDLNLSLRGYSVTVGFLGLVDYSGGIDPNAPQLAGLFGPNRLPDFGAVYQVNDWIWSCGSDGCPGPPITNSEVTLAGLVTTPGEDISIPERSPNIFGGDFKAMVLYAEEQRITLGYTRQDTVATGYAMHIENVCVDPNLLALYEAQVSSEGWHNTGLLPALGNNQALGTALGSEIQIAIRDRGAFLDPRSRKDWWQGY